jgi:uncharacterized HAD superfamily protein
VEFKSCEVDLVTETDQQVEKLLITNLKSKYPSHRYIYHTANIINIWEKSYEYHAIQHSFAPLMEISYGHLPPLH